MRTEDLITVLGRDPTLAPPRLVLRLVASVAVSLILLLIFWGAREDMASAIGNPLVLTKFALAATLAALLLFIQRRDTALWPALVPALAALVLFIVTLPHENRLAAISGNTLLACLVSIPLLALPVGIGLFIGLRHTIITRPARAGWLAGLIAGALATTLYALHCTEDAPAFYVLWYSAGILITGSVGRWLGPRVLGL